MEFSGFSRKRKKNKEPVARLVPSLQFRRALSGASPVLEVLAEQDKIKMQHYVPLHPRVILAIQPLLEGRDDDEAVFEYASFLQWVKRAKIPMTRFKGHFVLGDLRKFAEQYGDVIGWDQSNRAYPHPRRERSRLDAL